MYAILWDLFLGRGHQEMKWNTKSELDFFWSNTLLFGPKRFRNSKSPKSTICLRLSHDKEHCWLNVKCSWSWLSQSQIAKNGPLEWRNIFGPKCKVLYHVVFESGVRFLLLFVLMDATLLRLDLQKRTIYIFNFSTFYTFV